MSNLLKRLAFIVICISLPVLINAQEPAKVIKFKLAGKIGTEGKAIEGAKIDVKKANQNIQTILTTSNGKFEVLFDINTTDSLSSEFQVTFSKDGMLSKSMSINTFIGKPLAASYVFNLDVNMIVKKEDDIIIDLPSAKIKWSVRENKFIFDQTYAKIIQKIKEQDDPEKKKKLIEEQKRREEEEELKRKEAEKKAKEEEEKAASEALKKQAEAIRVQQEELAKQEAEKLAKEEAEKKLTEDAFKKQMEALKLQQEQIAKEEADKKAKEEAEKRAAAERLRKKAEELKKQMAEVKKQETPTPAPKPEVKVTPKEEPKTEAPKVKEPEPLPEPVPEPKETPKPAAVKAIEAKEERNAFAIKEIYSIRDIKALRAQKVVAKKQLEVKKTKNYESKYETKNPLTTLLNDIDEHEKILKKQNNSTK